MSQKLSLEILCIRHGKTAYTNAPNDLTPEGKAEVEQVAVAEVLPWIDAHRIDVRNLRIQSSTAPRAHYTAQCISEIIQRSKLFAPSLLPAEGLNPVGCKDEKRAEEVYRALRAGDRHVSYENEPGFQDPTIFELATEVRARWYDYLARYVMYHSAQPAVFVSHYEVLCNLTHDLFGIVATKDTELRHAEPIFLSVTEHDRENGLVLISGKFRNHTSEAIFNLWESSISRRT